MSSCKKSVHDESCELAIAEKAIDDDFLVSATNYITQFIPDFYKKYILDIDLDYFRTIAALKSTNLYKFKYLAKNAKIITVAKEKDCFDEKKLENDGFTVDLALELLKSIV